VTEDSQGDTDTVRKGYLIAPLFIPELFSPPMQSSITMQADSDDKDSVVAVWSSSDCTFTVPGNPTPQSRYDIGRGGQPFDPTKAKKLAFRLTVKDILELGDHQQPLFPKDTYLSITVIFRMKRPNNHFVHSNRAGMMLKSDAPKPLMVAKRVDVDNLLKFVMDAVNVLLYEDDKQVAAVHAFRLYDSQGACEGSTTVHLKQVSTTFPSCNVIPYL